MIDRTTELRRLAKLLEVERSTLGFLDTLSAEALQRLRRDINEALLAEFDTIFKKLAKAGKLIPVPLNAMLAERFFGPNLTAAMSYYMPHELSVKLLTRFSPEFVANVSAELIPERAESLMGQVPVDLMRPVTRLMTERKEFHVMGGIVDFLPPNIVLALMDEVDNPESNLRVSSFAQRKGRVADMVSQFSDDRMRELIATAFEHDDLLEEVLRVSTYMKEAQQKRAGDIVRTLGTEFFERGKAQAEAMGISDKLSAMLSA